ncbi:MAG TPA: TadE family protein [Rhizomicrobium sp.]|nr:TadE family protein [Rhizomicrobium sp.]
MRCARGTAAIEFAMLAVPFLALALGVVEFGRACWTLEALQESAVQGARCIGVHETGCYSSGSYSSTGTQSYVRTVANGWGINLPTADITPTQSTTCGTVAGFSQVQISYTFGTVVGLLIPSLRNETFNVASCFPLNP